YIDMDFTKILFQMHVSQTMSEKPPFTHAINGVEVGDLNIGKLRTLNNNNVEAFSKICYKIFKERYPRCLKGSVDIDPLIWVRIALNHLIKKIHEQDKDMFVFPNGCCTHEHCSINLFYEIIVEELLTNKKIINTNEGIEKMYGEEA
ncbi:unnamed protein product, partial [marine sediment metagenome]